MEVTVEVETCGQIQAMFKRLNWCNLLVGQVWGTRRSGNQTTAATGLVIGGVLTKKDKMGFFWPLLGTWPLPWKQRREKKQLAFHIVVPQA